MPNQSQIIAGICIYLPHESLNRTYPFTYISGNVEGF